MYRINSALLRLKVKKTKKRGLSVRLFDRIIMKNLVLITSRLLQKNKS